MKLKKKNKNKFSETLAKSQRFFVENTLKIAGYILGTDTV